MKFFFADSHDFIDPGFDFSSEEFSADRRAQHDDVYPHQYFEAPPYDGMLVSRATVGDERVKGKYSTTQSWRFRRDGAVKYLRYDPRANGGALMGDCGAFSYVKMENPPYTIPEMFDFYAECGFTHGVSIDHAILGYDERLDGPNLFDGGSPPAEWQRRFDVTLDLAGQFRDYCHTHNAPFQPIGVAQGWSPKSYARAVQVLVRDMGYDYIALGGMVPLKVEQIHRCLEEVRQIAPDVKIHLFGFTKADNLHEFVPYNLESFDSTSPMLRAFKDGSKNYFIDGRWYTAIRVPQADELRTLKMDVLAGIKNQRSLRAEERTALDALRSYAAGELDLQKTLESVVTYGRHISDQDRSRPYRETLGDRPWERCPCRVCCEAGIEVVIFRGSNRNRRRGFHNLWQVHRQLRRLVAAGVPSESSRTNLAHAPALSVV